MWFSLCAPNQTSACGRLASASIRDRAGPEDRNTICTSTPVAFVKALRMRVAFSSSTLEYTVSACAELAIINKPANAASALFFMVSSVCRRVCSLLLIEAANYLRHYSPSTHVHDGE